MPKKMKFGDYYRCGACNLAGRKEDWKPVDLGIGEDVRICPECGALMVINICNEVDDPIEYKEKPADKPKGGAKK